jgi:hypothetical protein
MKANTAKKGPKKFDLEKMNVAKLKNIHLINGGDGIEGDDPINTTDKSLVGSSRYCK